MNDKYAELLGIMSGDGCLSNVNKRHMVYVCGHKLDDYAYHEKVTRTLFKEVFNKETHLWARPDENVVIVRFSDKKIFDSLAKYLPIGRKYETLSVPEGILTNKKNFFAYMRGLVDTDGTVTFSKQHKLVRYYPRIEITSKSKTFLQTLLIQLILLGFYGSVSHAGNNAYRLEIPGVKNLSLWLEKIGFNNKKHIAKIKRNITDADMRYLYESGTPRNFF